MWNIWFDRSFILLLLMLWTTFDKNMRRISAAQFLLYLINNWKQICILFVCTENHANQLKNNHSILTPSRFCSFALYEIFKSDRILLRVPRWIFFKAYGIKSVLSGSAMMVFEILCCLLFAKNGVIAYP